MERTGIKKLFLKKADYELQLEREGESRETYLENDIFHEEVMPRTYSRQPRSNAPLPRASETSQTIHGNEEIPKTAGTFITSPMVGTFYASPSPDDPTFVKVGDQIDKNTVVCIIEAMKVMNEIKAGISGTVVEALVESGHPVEFGTKLYRIQ